MTTAPWKNLCPCFAASASSAPPVIPIPLFLFPHATFFPSKTFPHTPNFRKNAPPPSENLYRRRIHRCHSNCRHGDPPPLQRLLHRTRPHHPSRRILRPRIPARSSQHRRLRLHRRGRNARPVRRSRRYPRHLLTRSRSPAPHRVLRRRS